MLASWEAWPVTTLPVASDDTINLISEAIREMEEGLRDAEPAVVIDLIGKLAERKGVELPSPDLVTLDARLIARELPGHLVWLAFERLYTSFRWPRLPEVGDWMEAVRDELERERQPVMRLKLLRSRLLLRRELEDKAARMRGRQRKIGRQL